MDYGTGTSADQTRDASLPVCARNRAKESRSLAAGAQTRCSTKCVPGSEAAPRLDGAQDPQHRPWADLPPDILGVVAARLALLEDRARLRSVCRAWRAAARIHRRLPPCPPLLVLSDFSFFSFRPEGIMMGACRRVPLPERETLASGSARCVGSFEGWLVGVKNNKSRYFGDLRCFLMNAFSQAVIRLPPPSGGAARFADNFSASLPIINGSGVVNCAIKAAPRVMSFSKVILSCSPDSGSKCVVAAISEIKSATKLALWRSGMKSWCVCDGGWTADLIDIVFCQGKLFMLSFSEVTTNLLALEIADDHSSGLMVSHVELCAIEMPEVSASCWQNIWSIVEWRGKLLIVVTCRVNDEFGESFVEVRVFEADLSTNPVRLTEIESLDGDCIFISPFSTKSFRSCHYGGGGGEGQGQGQGDGEGDLIYGRVQLSKNFDCALQYSITSNFVTHVWRIKCK